MNFTGLKLHNHARPGLSVTQHVRRNKLWTQNVVYYHLRIVFCTVGGLGKSDPFSAPYKPVTLFYAMYSFVRSPKLDTITPSIM